MSQDFEPNDDIDGAITDDRILVVQDDSPMTAFADQDVHTTHTAATDLTVSPLATALEEVRDSLDWIAPSTGIDFAPDGETVAPDALAFPTHDADTDIQFAAPTLIQTWQVPHPNAGDPIHGGSGDDFMNGTGDGEEIWGHAGNDELYGHGGDDTIMGGQGNDSLLGGIGNNLLNGAGGFDKAEYQIASTSVTITRNSAGSATIVGSGFSDKYEKVEAIIFPDKVVVLSQLAHTDLDGDGTSDIIWHNAAGGATNYFSMANGSVSSWNLAGAVNTAWAAAGSGDFNRDGNADILFRRGSDGALGFLGHSSAGSWTWIGAGVVNQAWTLVGIDDVNLDGDADLIYINTAVGGAIGVYNMQNGVGTWTGEGFVDASTWTAVGTGDTNADGWAEVIFDHNTAGVTGSYDVNGVWRQIGTAIDDGWHVGGVGDLDGNGTDDVLMYNQQMGGGLGYWKMDYNGNATWADFREGGAGLGAIGSTWTPEAMGDFNNDGQTDVLFYNAGNTAAGVLLITNNGATATWSGLGAVNAAWQIV